MLTWTWKNLWAEPGSNVAAVVAVAAAALLALAMRAVFVGESQQIVRYLERSDAEVWVMQSGTRNMHMASSLLPQASVARLEELDGVKEATPVLYLNAFLELGEDRLFSYVVGLPASAERGGAWALAEGVGVPNRGEAVVPAAAAEAAGLSLGEPVQIAGHPFTIVGLSRETRSMANTLVFVELSDLQELMSAPATVSYVLLDLHRDADPGLVAAEARQAVPGINALTTPEFVANDYAMAMEMGVDLIRVMNIVGALLATLIIGFTAWSGVTRRRRELAIVKALGASDSSLLLAVAGQTAAVGLLGFLLAAALATVGAPLAAHLFPDVALGVLPEDLLALLGLILTASLPAACIPARSILRLDPVDAFR